MTEPQDNIASDTILEEINALNTLEQELERLRNEKNATQAPTQFVDPPLKKTTEKQPKSPEHIQQKTKKVDELKHDIYELEAAMQIDHRNLKGFKKKELEAYLAELMDKAGTTLSLGLEPSEEKPIEHKPSENGRASTEGAQRPVFPDAQPPISQQLRNDIKQQMQAAQVEKAKGNVIADSLFQFNAICMYLLERTSEEFEDKLGCSITGATRDLREDYANPDSPLREIYAQIHEKYGKTLEPYLDPLTRLTVYNLAVVQRSIKKKIEKKKDQQNDT